MVLRPAFTAGMTKSIAFLSVAAGLIAQASLTAQTLPPASGGKIRILVLQGSGGVNYLKTSQILVPVVAVLDENDRPVEGATVVFDLPTTGPGASFEGGRFTQTLATNLQGQAAATGFRPNGQAGRFTIHVEASFNGAKAETSFIQINSLREVSIAPSSNQAKKKSSAKWWILAGVLAGAAAGGIYYATSHGGSSAPNTVTITVQPGPISVGAP
jgi:hypothetical protein